MPEQWYVARSKPSQARIALERLTQQHFTTYWPQIEIERVKAGKVIKIREPLFPGYLFVLFELQPQSGAPSMALEAFNVY